MQPAFRPSWLGRGAALALALLLSACGGGGSGGDSGPAANTVTVSVPAAAAAGNVVDVIVDKGADGSAVNSPFVSVTVCVPGSATCKTIDHILLDTGSFGLRLDAAVVQGLGLPSVNDANSGQPLGECAQFASGYMWGSVRSADVKIGGESTSRAVSVQVTDDPSPNYAKPAGCTSVQGKLDPAGSNGILGVGFFAQDCGSGCVTGAANNVYFACQASGTCASVNVPLASQVTNPVTLFAADNNGISLSMPAVPLGGAASAKGTLVFGIGTQANNQPAVRPVYLANSRGEFSTTYKGAQLTAFIDSGSNGLFFPDRTIPACTRSLGFYCSPTPLSLTATITGSGSNPPSVAVPFTVEDAETLAPGTAVANLGGNIGGTQFDWGLPFFFGRTVVLAFQGKTTPQATGPYWSF